LGKRYGILNAPGFGDWSVHTGAYIHVHVCIKITVLMYVMCMIHDILRYVTVENDTRTLVVHVVHVERMKALARFIFLRDLIFHQRFSLKTGNSCNLYCTVL
jgi:hypothetical protein